MTDEMAFINWDNSQRPTPPSQASARDTKITLFLHNEILHLNLIHVVYNNLQAALSWSNIDDWHLVIQKSALLLLFPVHLRQTT